MDFIFLLIVLSSELSVLKELLRNDIVQLRNGNQEHCGEKLVQKNGVFGGRSV